MISHYTKETGKIFEQNNQSIALNLEQENKTLLLMINDDDDDDDEKYYYFSVKSKLELYLSEWLTSKKESITNEDINFQNALNDSLDYQRIKKDPQKILKLKSYINQYNWKDIKLPLDKEEFRVK